MPEGSAERQSRLDFRALWRNVSWTSTSVAVTTLLAFAETILLVRVLGATLLGIFILVRIYPEVVQQVLDCRTRETIVRYLGEFVALNQRERACALVRLVWMVDAAAGLAGMAVVFATASLAVRYIVHDTALVWPMALYAVAQFAETLDSASGPVLRVFDRFKFASMMGVGKCLVRFAVILAVLLSGGGVVPLIYALVAVEITYLLVSSCISISLLRRSIGNNRGRP
jgi:O-antigen/teichoic acid export membrane protein